MPAPIPPSLSQLLNPQTQPARPQPQAAQPVRFSDALTAQKAFFQQITQPKITPATYTAADIAKASATKPAQTVPAADDSQPLRRPGSYLNIVV